jgi:hypothetical protein
VRAGRDRPGAVFHRRTSVRSPSDGFALNPLQFGSIADP